MTVIETNPASKLSDNIDVKSLTDLLLLILFCFY